MSTKHNEEELSEVFKDLGSSENLEEATKNSIKDFGELLDSIKTLDSKQKLLWAQIYENAVTDRMYAKVAFIDLYLMVHSHEDKHAIHGQTLAKYLERMEKSNTQIQKLSELISKEKEKEVAESIPEGKALFQLIENATGASSKKSRS